MNDGSFSVDENNNEALKNTKNFYVERHLELIIGGEDFLIIPNGGSGDCMFKAVSQAVYQGDECKHREIRKRVVNFVISQRWEKFHESIEVQHINGNNILQRQWVKDPKEAYKMYMTLAGTLGSSSELTAAGELFHYNFATIQEYCSATQTTYRVENCVLYDEDMANFHYFYFTGDYDNGHWEYIKNLSGRTLDDGTYQGRHRIVINGEEITFEDWLRRETENNNDADQLKIATNHSLYARRRTSHPFELKGFQFCRDGTVRLKGNSFTIAPVQCSDLFSVLAHECLKNEASAHEIELILMKHRYQYFEEINYKLITQPWSHNFSVDALRYCGQSLKGNIQDLIAAADLYNFSFILFLKMSDDEDTHKCNFTHVDRWGGESDRILFFFMRLSRSKNGENEQLIAKWWRLVPVDANSPYSSEAKLFQRKSASYVDGGDSRAANKSSLNRSFSTFGAGRPMTVESYGTHASKKSSAAASSRPSSIQGCNVIYKEPIAESSKTIFHETTLMQKEPKCQVLEGGITVTRISDSDKGMETDECLRKDHDKIFGSSPEPLARKNSLMVTTGKQMWRKSVTRLIKGSNIKKEKVKPATASDLLKHPDKVKTVVKISDKSNTGRELTYSGKGYMKADDVLTDLHSQGLIRMSTAAPTSVTSYSRKNISSGLTSPKIMFADPDRAPTRHNYEAVSSWKDENSNIFTTNKHDENEVSEVSYENFSLSARGSHTAGPHDNLFAQDPQERQYSRPTLFQQSPVESPGGRTNKVAPNLIKSNHRVKSGGQIHDRKIDNNESCIDRFLQALSRLCNGIRSMARGVKKGFVRRYEGYQNSSTVTLSRGAVKTQKTFPRRSF